MPYPTSPKVGIIAVILHWKDCLWELVVPPQSGGLSDVDIFSTLGIPFEERKRTDVSHLELRGAHPAEILFKEESSRHLQRLFLSHRLRDGGCYDLGFTRNNIMVVGRPGIPATKEKLCKLEERNRWLQRGEDVRAQQDSNSFSFSSPIPIPSLRSQSSGRRGVPGLQSSPSSPNFQPASPSDSRLAYINAFPFGRPSPPSPKPPPLLRPNFGDSPYNSINTPRSPLHPSVAPLHPSASVPISMSPRSTSPISPAFLGRTPSSSGESPPVFPGRSSLGAIFRMHPGGPSPRSTRPADMRSQRERRGAPDPHHQARAQLDEMLLNCISARQELLAIPDLFVETDTPKQPSLPPTPRNNTPPPVPPATSGTSDIPAEQILEPPGEKAEERPAEAHKATLERRTESKRDSLVIEGRHSPFSALAAVQATEIEKHSSTESLPIFDFERPALVPIIGGTREDSPVVSVQEISAPSPLVLPEVSEKIDTVLLSPTIVEELVSDDSDLASPKMGPTRQNRRTRFHPEVEAGAEANAADPGLFVPIPEPAALGVPDGDERLPHLNSAPPDAHAANTAGGSNEAAAFEPVSPPTPAQGLASPTGSLSTLSPTIRRVDTLATKQMAPTSSFKRVSSYRVSPVERHGKLKLNDQPCGHARKFWVAELAHSGETGENSWNCICCHKNYLVTIPGVACSACAELGTGTYMCRACHATRRNFFAKGNLPAGGVVVLPTVKSMPALRRISTGTSSNDKLSSSAPSSFKMQPTTAAQPKAPTAPRRTQTLSLRLSRPHAA